MNGVAAMEGNYPSKGVRPLKNLPPATHLFSRPADDYRAGHFRWPVRRTEKCS